MKEFLKLYLRISLVVLLVILVFCTLIVGFIFTSIYLGTIGLGIFVFVSITLCWTILETMAKHYDGKT